MNSTKDYTLFMFFYLSFSIAPTHAMDPSVQELVAQNQPAIIATGALLVLPAIHVAMTHAQKAAVFLQQVLPLKRAHKLIKSYADEPEVTHIEEDTGEKIEVGSAAVEICEWTDRFNWLKVMPKTAIEWTETASKLKVKPIITIKRIYLEVPKYIRAIEDFNSDKTKALDLQHAKKPGYYPDTEWKIDRYYRIITESSKQSKKLKQALGL